jgi:DNA-binding NtrC family response regulator
VLPLSETNSIRDSLRVAKSKVIGHFEKGFIENLLLIHQGNITASAAAAGKNRRAFWELIRKHKIDVEYYRYRKAI